MIRYIYFITCVLFGLAACEEHSNSIANGYDKSNGKFVSADVSISVGAEQMGAYYPYIKDRKIGLVVNQTSMVNDKHLVDTLLELEADIAAIFAPEHGFRGEADAGEHITSGKDPLTGVNIVSIYGKNKKPTKEQLAGIDLMIFDIQDVGARFYTYISTLHYIMEACAENNIPLLVLDRPNPNGFFVDGPVLDKNYKSFVGMHKIPVVHGMTVGEYAKMINGENWLPDGMQCELVVIPCVNYTHNMTYDLPIKPSPNLPNLRSILLYPSICFFEGTKISIGRGTDKQFQLIGHPELDNYEFTFTPESKPGATSPKLQGQKCYGRDLTELSVDYLKGVAKLDLSYLLEAYQAFPDKEEFFLKSSFFDRLAGSDQLRKQIQAGLSEKEIRASWEPALSNYKRTRSKYLIYE
ncbi:exo-beta-N-acetylmuramidase NamZ family protein [Portibacter marinus]|uniref:exo-beta-N-acetylmuramidase NamZ family protein n=1 Tax=Portibacter marinus TaxID=2898660 RepID=UPI001F4415D5|nr:DUF1343 domain-containing protein [Portibacter marinus]